MAFLENILLILHAVKSRTQPRPPHLRASLQDVVIEAVAAEGKSLFHVDERVVFVPFCVPGDVVDVQITRKKHNYMEGVVVQFNAYSDVRAVPTCQHFGVFCG